MALGGKTWCYFPERIFIIQNGFQDELKNIIHTWGLPWSINEQCFHTTSCGNIKNTKICRTFGIF